MAGGTPSSSTRLTGAERLVLTLLLAAVAVSAGWQYWRIHRITHTPMPQSVWADTDGEN